MTFRSHVYSRNILALAYEHDPDFPDVDPATGDEQETTDLNREDE